MREQEIQVVHEGKDVREVAATAECCKTGPQSLRTTGSG